MLSQVQKDIDARRELFNNACANIAQANVDLIVVTMHDDTEKRSLTYHIENALVREYKYQLRLNEVRKEREQIEETKKNESFFEKYIAMTPPKSLGELITIAERFKVKLSPELAIFKSLLAAQLAAPAATAAPAVPEKKTA
jgi:mannose/cellobiose epimerase-like protein (N-acyl-D-glucosamine 2-epimerase family)